ncbi:MAG: hypothetical protein FHP94_13145 [Denitromonas halophila]|nr:MAG: hypothetical protein FHP94_13145 [Denitromonas halophila]
MVKEIALAALGVLLLSCNAHSDNQLRVTEITEVGTEGTSGDFCADFVLSEKQAQAYFAHASVVTQQTVHDDYDVLPCFVRGSGKRGSQSCEWEINAGGTGHVNCAQQSYLTACKDCLPR